MKTLLCILLLSSSLFAAHPKCEVKSSQSSQKLGTVSGTASGFQSGRVYVTLTQGNRKYTTVAEREGNWAISFADLETESKISCWQEGTGLVAETSLKHN